MARLLIPHNISSFSHVLLSATSARASRSSKLLPLLQLLGAARWRISLYWEHPMLVFVGRNQRPVLHPPVIALIPHIFRQRRLAIDRQHQRLEQGIKVLP